MKPLTHFRYLAWIIILWAGWLAMPAINAQNADSQSQFDNELMQGLLVAPRVFRAAVKKIEPCLVTIESFGGVSTIEGKIGGIRKQGEGNTTGVIISPDGFVVTSLFNFIQQPPVITVITSDGQRRVAHLKGRDNTRNICLLKIDDVDSLPVPEMAPLNEIHVGQWAISVGVGYGDKTPAISTGIVSAKGRIGGRAIQTDANISPANYGGPLIDVQGRMIGVCVPLAPGARSSGAGVEWYDSGIGFAIPLYGYESILERLKQGDTIEPGFIGVLPQFVAGTRGARIAEVINNSPAEKAGLKKGETITEIDGQTVIDAASMRVVLNRYVAGDRITLTIQSGEEENLETRSVELELAVRPENDPTQLNPEPELDPQDEPPQPDEPGQPDREDQKDG